MFNVSGAICWVGIFLTAGYFFGGWKPIKENFSFVTLGIIVVSVLPVIRSLQGETGSCTTEAGKDLRIFRASAGLQEENPQVRTLPTENLCARLALLCVARCPGVLCHDYATPRQ